MKIGVELKLFERKLEFWKLFENWNLKNGILKKNIYMKMRVLKTGILKNYLKIGVLKIKIENWNCEKLFENRSFKN